MKDSLHKEVVGSGSLRYVQAILHPNDSKAVPKNIMACWPSGDEDLAKSSETEKQFIDII